MRVRFPLAWFITPHSLVNFDRYSKLIRLRARRDNLTVKLKVRYSLNFRSLIAPSSSHLTSSLLFNTPATLPRKKTNFTRILVKQSYLLLTWFYLLTRTKFVTSPKFFIKPYKQTKFTTIKSPMAHKTFSQEQYVFRFYSINVSYGSWVATGSSATSINEALYLLMVLRSSTSFNETNLFLLQRFSVFMPSSGGKYLTIV